MIRYLKGLKANLPLTGVDAESIYITTDTNEVFRSTGNGQPLEQMTSVVTCTTLPGTGVQGKIYITATDDIYRWNGTEFKPLAAKPGTFTATSTDELQNKTIDATKNTIQNLTVGNMAAAAVTNDGTLATDSATKLTTEHAVKAYVDGVLSTVSLGDLGGDLDASGAAFPANSVKGYYYPVTVAGTIGGMDLSIGDLVIARKDNASTTLATDWIKIDNTEASDILRTGNISTNTDLTVDPTKVPDRSTVKAAIDAALTWETF